MSTPPEAHTGLSPDEARARLARDGENALATTSGPTALRILVAQLRGVMTWLLIGASIVSLLVGEVVDAIVIVVVVVLNVAIGFFQEYRAERAMHALGAMTAPHARVVRGGHLVDVEARHVVRGDVLALEAGDLVAADALLLEAADLAANEAALTGESVPVDKRVESPVAPDGGAPAPSPVHVPLAEQRGQVFMGTAITRGRARARVTSTGMSTELGKIATLLARAEDEATPLTRHLERTGRVLVVLCLGIVALIAALGLVAGRPPLEVLMTAVTLAVAAVPEGLTAFITIALALGVERMAKRHVLVRTLPSVETLGCATVVCTDKTGTLTTGVMVVRDVWGVDPRRVLDVAAACCDADLSGGVGDPTEIAILRAAADAGIDVDGVERARPRVHENPFDAERKRMSVLRSDGVLSVKGALELLAPLCTRGDIDGARAAERAYAERGLRVLGVAVGRTEREEDLELIGVIGMADPPRDEAIAAVQAAKRAGIATIMITGDSAITAHAIARELGIVDDSVDPATRVYARATPEDKLTLVRRMKREGAIVAMTGDGVNDAPALKEAHIGIAMGKTGTEVTREASDMVLTDDRFDSIVAAIREGRGIFDNIQRTMIYLLQGNAGELLLMFAASVLSLPLPLTPLQILWVNLITDSFPALALITAPTQDDVLTRPPRPPTEPMLGAREWRAIVLTALIEATVVFAVYLAVLDARGPEHARTLAFLTLVTAEVARVFSARSRDRTFFEVGIAGHAPLLVVVALCALAQLVLFGVPSIGAIFDVTPIDLARDAWVFVVALVPVTLVELSKLARRALTR